MKLNAPCLGLESKVYVVFVYFLTHFFLLSLSHIFGSLVYIVVHPSYHLA